MNQDNQQLERERVIEKKIHKTKIYVQFLLTQIIVMGFNSSGKTQFIESLICNQLNHEREYKVIKYHKQEKKYYDGKIHKIQIPSLFHQGFDEEIQNKLRIIDTPGIEKIDEIGDILNEVDQIIQENPFILVWILDYENIFNQKLFAAMKREYLNNNKGSTFLILNKIDLRTMQDQSLEEIYQQFNKSNVYALSSKNIYAYNILNYGTEEQKAQYMENYYTRHGSFLRLTRSTLTKHCQLNIQQNKNLVDEDYSLLIKNLTQIINICFQNRIQELRQQQQQYQLNLNLANQKLELVSKSINLIQSEWRNKLQALNFDNDIDIKDSNNWNRRSIEKFFLKQNNDILYLTEQTNIINENYQQKILKEIQFHIIGKIAADEDDELEIIESPEVEREKQIISDYFHDVIHRQQPQLKQLNNEFIKSYQTLIDTFNAYTTNYMAQKTKFKSGIMTCKQVVYPLLFLEFGIKITIGLLIISLTEVLKIQDGELDPLIDDQFQTFTKNYKLLTEKFKNENEIYFNQVAQQIKDFLKFQLKQ